MNYEINSTATIKEVKKVFKRRVAFDILEKRLPETSSYTSDNGLIISEAVRSYAYKIKRPRYPLVLVTQKPLIENYFFIHFGDLNITICSTSDWKSYEPPSLRVFLLYIGIRALLVYKNDAHSHHQSRGCILDLCKRKTDIRLFLKPDIKEPFCDSCNAKYQNSMVLISPYFKVLIKWINTDFNAYNLKLKTFLTLGRYSIYGACRGQKVIREITMDDKCSIVLHPCPFTYRYFKEHASGEVRDITQMDALISHLIQINELDSRIKITMSEDA
jgi:hypothetical protein